MSKDYGSLTADNFNDSGDSSMNFLNAFVRYVQCADNMSNYVHQNEDNIIFFNGKEIKYQYTNFSSTSSPYFRYNTPLCTLNNGMTLFINRWKSGSPGYLIGIDTNGIFKKPNRWGFDLFTFQIPEDKPYILKPMNYIACSKNYSGLYPHYNGAACAHYASLDKNPDDMTKSYWDSL